MIHSNSKYEVEKRKVEDLSEEIDRLNEDVKFRQNEKTEIQNLNNLLQEKVKQRSKEITKISEALGIKIRN
jgi:peptidoglycan hydrolase CwlO-like protein